MAAGKVLRPCSFKADFGHLVASQMGLRPTRSHCLARSALGAPVVFWPIWVVAPSGSATVGKSFREIGSTTEGAGTSTARSADLAQMNV